MLMMELPFQEPQAWPRSGLDDQPATVLGELAMDSDRTPTLGGL